MVREPNGNDILETELGEITALERRLNCYSFRGSLNLNGWRE